MACSFGRLHFPIHFCQMSVKEVLYNSLLTKKYSRHVIRVCSLNETSIKTIHSRNQATMSPRLNSQSRIKPRFRVVEPGLKSDSCKDARHKSPAQIARITK